MTEPGPDDRSPAIDVVIPARNAAATLGKTLESLASARDLLRTVFVVDDGSTDDTADVARQTGRRLGLPVELLIGPQQGVGAARNLALGRTTAPYIYMLDGDDLVMDGAIFRLWELARAGADLAIGATIDRTPDGDRLHLPVRADKDAKRLAERYLQHRAALIRPGSALLRREALGSQRFPERCSVGEDGVFWAGILRRITPTAVGEPPVLIYFTDPSRYEARYLRQARRNYLGYARAARALAREGLSAEGVARARGLMATAYLQALERQGEKGQARSFLRIALASGLPLRRLLRLLRDYWRAGWRPKFFHLKLIMSKSPFGDGWNKP